MPGPPKRAATVRFMDQPFEDPELAATCTDAEFWQVLGLQLRRRKELDNGVRHDARQVIEELRRERER
jgi:hypothetical protein